MLLNCGVGEDSWVPWTARRSNQSILKEISPEYSFEGLMLKPKLQYFPIPDGRNWLIRKVPDDGKDWRQEEKGTTEDEMVGWHHQLNGHEHEQAPGVGDGQGNLACCCPWGCKESDTTEHTCTHTHIHTRARAQSRNPLLVTSLCAFWEWSRGIRKRKNCHELHETFKRNILELIRTWYSNL